MPVTVGTAGHIDHGKTWLVRALTGKDTDRLPEEKERGISIDLGYAPLELPDGRRLSLVDVPGHERFVRTMIAGATGIDLFLLVIDAGEGARPQTHEHLAIIRLLGIEHGVVAVTKADAVDEETLELALEEARELVPGAAVVAVSAKTGTGLDELRAELAAAADRVHRAARARPTRLFVDRVFTLRGIGTVATGTLWSGSIGDGDELRAEPARPCRPHPKRAGARPAGGRAQTRGSASRSASPGSSARELHRGQALVAPGAYPASYRLDVTLEELAADQGRRAPARPPRHGRDPAVVRRIGERHAQLRLSSPAVAARGDRVVLRGETTLGGGAVLDPSPPRHASAERIELIERGDVAATIHAPVSLDSLAPRPRRRAGRRRACRRLAVLARLAGRAAAGARAQARRLADPLDPGVHPPAEPWAAAVVPLLGLERRGAKLYRPGVAASLGEREAAAAELEAAPRARARQDRRREARPLPRAAGAARPARRRYGRIGRRRSSRPGRRSSPSARRRAGSHSPVSATCSGSAGARRSCSSSASMPTA